MDEATRRDVEHVINFPARARRRSRARRGDGMDLLLIVRDACASALIGTLVAARDARDAGRAVGVLVTGEALAAVAGGAFAWPRELSGYPLRLALADRGKALGLPVAAKGEGR